MTISYFISAPSFKSTAFMIWILAGGRVNLTPPCFNTTSEPPCTIGLSFIRPMPNTICNIHNPLRVKYLARLRIGFSHLKEHKFKHNFQDSIDPMCSCSSGIKTTIHFFLHCTNFNIQRQTLFDKIATIDANVLTENEDSIVNAILFGKPNCENSFNKAMLNASVEHILSTERFKNPLF